MYSILLHELIPGPERSPIRHPDNRPRPVDVAGEIQAILLEVREKRKLRLEARRFKVIEGPEGRIIKRLMEDAETIDRVAVSKEDLALLEESIKTGARRRNALATTSLAMQRAVGATATAIRQSGFRHRRRGDEYMHNALSNDKRPTRLQRFSESLWGREIQLLPRLARLVEKTRGILFRPSVRQEPELKFPKEARLIYPYTRREVLAKQVKKHDERVPLRKVTFYVMGKYPQHLPEADKFLLPAWARDAVESRGFTSLDALNWVKVIRAPNAVTAFEIMESAGSKWPKFLVQMMLYSASRRSQGELVKIFEQVQNAWETFDQGGKVKALIRMAELSANKLPQGLPRVAHLLTLTEFHGKGGKDRALKVCNDVLAKIANAHQTKSSQNYTSANQLRNLIDDAMVTLLGHMAEKQIQVKVSTLRKVSSAKLAEDTEAAIKILKLATPTRFTALTSEMDGQENDLALAHEVSKVEKQLSAIEKEYLKGHRLGRVKSTEMINRLRTIQNWRVSAEETFSAWLDFLKRRRELGPAPKEAWMAILRMCHDEWTFPTAFWIEAFELMEEDGALPNVPLLCLVLKGINELDVLDRILEISTTNHMQRMNDRIWTTYLQRLCINHAPRALEIFLNAHNSDSAAGTMDTLNVVYWNILLNGLHLESRRTNDMVWITRAFDLISEMERLTIFPTQQSLSILCKLGLWGGDKVRVGEENVPAWEAALHRWHEWIVRPEDFGYKFYLPGVLRLIPSQATWRKFIRLAGNYGEYNEVFDASWAMVRFGVQPDWEILLDIDVFMQLSGDEERTLAVREMFREWLNVYPSPRDVLWHYRKWLRAEVETAILERDRTQPRLRAPEEASGPTSETDLITQDGQVLKSIDDVLPDVEVHDETVVEQWIRRERAKPWFERD
jgi:hypothetical protein